MDLMRGVRRQIGVIPHRAVVEFHALNFRRLAVGIVPIHGIGPDRVSLCAVLDAQVVHRRRIPYRPAVAPVAARPAPLDQRRVEVVRGDARAEHQSVRVVTRKLYRVLPVALIKYQILHLVGVQGVVSFAADEHRAAFPAIPDDIIPLRAQDDFAFLPAQITRCRLRRQAALAGDEVIEAERAAVRKPEILHRSLFAVDDDDAVRRLPVPIRRCARLHHEARAERARFVAPADVVGRDARAERHFVRPAEVDDLVLAVAEVEAVGVIQAAAVQDVAARAAMEGGRGAQPVQRVRAVGVGVGVGDVDPALARGQLLPGVFRAVGEAEALHGGFARHHVDGVAPGADGDVEDLPLVFVGDEVGVGVGVGRQGDHRAVDADRGAAQADHVRRDARAEFDRVVAGQFVDRVAPVARVEQIRVVARAAEQNVVARAALEEVVVDGAGG